MVWSLIYSSNHTRPKFFKKAENVTIIQFIFFAKGIDYKVFQRFEEHKTGFLIRIKDNVSYISIEK